MNYERMWKDLKSDLLKLKAERVDIIKILIATDYRNGQIQGIHDSIDRMEIIEELENMNQSKG